MEKLPTAESIIRNQFCGEEFDEIMGYLNNSIEPSIKLAMIEFAKLHVEQALKEASEKVKLTDFACEFLQEGASDAIKKDSILNSYPPENIK